MITKEELNRLKAISKELRAMHEKNTAIRFLFCYHKGETSAIERIGSNVDMYNFISGFIESDDSAQKVVLSTLNGVFEQ